MSISDGITDQTRSILADLEVDDIISIIQSKYDKSVDKISLSSEIEEIVRLSLSSRVSLADTIIKFQSISSYSNVIEACNTSIAIYCYFQFIQDDFMALLSPFSQYFHQIIRMIISITNDLKFNEKELIFRALVSVQITLRALVLISQILSQNMNKFHPEFECVFLVLRSVLGVTYQPLSSFLRPSDHEKIYFIRQGWHVGSEGFLDDQFLLKYLDPSFIQHLIMADLPPHTLLPSSERTIWHHLIFSSSSKLMIEKRIIDESWKDDDLTLIAINLGKSLSKSYEDDIQAHALLANAFYSLMFTSCSMQSSGSSSIFSIKQLRMNDRRIGRDDTCLHQSS